MKSRVYLLYKCRCTGLPKASVNGGSRHKKKNHGTLRGFSFYEIYCCLRLNGCPKFRTRRKYPKNRKCSCHGCACGYACAFEKNRRNFLYPWMCRSCHCSSSRWCSYQTRHLYWLTNLKCGCVSLPCVKNCGSWCRNDGAFLNDVLW